MNAGLPEMNCVLRSYEFMNSYWLICLYTETRVNQSHAITDCDVDRHTLKTLTSLLLHLCLCHLLFTKSQTANIYLFLLLENST